MKLANRYTLLLAFLSPDSYYNKPLKTNNFHAFQPKNSTLTAANPHTPHPVSRANIRTPSTTREATRRHKKARDSHRGLSRPKQQVAYSAAGASAAG
jgi:hypothetical protein